MRDNLQFEVTDVTVSEFASQDADGKQILIGIFTNVANFADTAKTLPQWFISVTLKPLMKEFNYTVEFVAPNSHPIIRLACKFKANGEPNDETWLVSAVQLPNIPFPGFGDYLIRIRDAQEDVIFRKPFSMRLGRKEPVDVEFTATAQLNTDFIGGMAKSRQANVPLDTASPKSS